MKTKILTIYLFCLGIINANAQAPAILWQKSFGGTGSDIAYSIKQTADGGYIVAGTTASINGDVTANHGGVDYLVIKTNKTGDVEWKKCLGGTGDEGFQTYEDLSCSIEQTQDGGYILAGSSTSNDGDVTGHHGNSSSYDCWIVKLSSTGSIEWQKSLGGTDIDRAYSIHSATDGGYIMAGVSSSVDGDVTGNHGLQDYWIVKLSSTGIIQWQKSFGGSGIDRATDVQQTTDGGYMAAGWSKSVDGDVTGGHGAEDYWIIKLSSAGIIEWKKSLGGSNFDLLYSIEQTTDGGYIAAGASSSNNGDVSGNNGGVDYWIVKLDGAGIIQWQKSLGGSSDDFAKSAEQTTDGGYIISGHCTSNDGEVTGHQGLIGSPDYWIVKLNSSGAIQWQKCLGGKNYDQAYVVQQTTDGCYIVAGGSRSAEGEITDDHGADDFWLAKMTSNYNTITGTCFIDYNKNGLKDNGEPGYKNLRLTFSGKTFSPSATTDLLGGFFIYADTGTSIISAGKLRYYINTPASYTTSFTTYGNAATMEIPLSPAGDVQDLHITLLGTTRERLGTDFTYKMVYSNVGLKTMSGSAMLIMDHRLSFVSSKPSYNSMDGDTIRWSYFNLAPNDSGSIDVVLHAGIPPVLYPADTIYSKANIEPVLTDTVPEDNAAVLTAQIFGSYDPNDKAMTEGNNFPITRVQNGEYLTYLIRFQNTGNDTAFKVVVRDTLDDKLDASTLEMVSTSHPYQLDITNSKNISWKFSNILLPDSNVNEPASHGYICYRVKPLSTLLAGSIIRNTAYIYFDYNPAVATNTTKTTIASAVKVIEIVPSVGFNIYPNPTKGRLTIELKEAATNASLNIINAIGETIYQSLIKKEKTDIDLSAISAGIYFIQVRNEDAIYTQRIIIE